MAGRQFVETANGNLRLPANIYTVKGNLVDVRVPERKLGDAKAVAPYGADFHPHRGQKPIWYDEKTPFQILLAGSQGGKSHIGPIVMWREIERAVAAAPHVGHEFAIIAPTLEMQRRTKVGLARMVRFFEDRFGWSERTILNKQDWRINLRPVGLEVDIYSGTAERIHRLQGSALDSAWIDEGGIVPEKAIYYTTVQRLSGAGRLLVTTTPYVPGSSWLRPLIEEAAEGRPNLLVVRFPSLVNPHWSLEQDNRQKEELPWWYYNMMYNAQFEQPQGLVYPDVTYIEPFAIPQHWTRIMGIDPTHGGQDEFAAVWIAYDPWQPDIWYLYREFYLPCTPKLKAHDQRVRQPHEMLDAIYDASVVEVWDDEQQATVPTEEREYVHRIFIDPSDPGVRRDVENIFTDASVYKADPKLDGLMDVGRMLKTGRLLVFKNLINFQYEQTSYIYPYNQFGDVVGDKPLDRNNHLMDAMRYAIRQSEDSRALADPSFG